MNIAVCNGCRFNPNLSNWANLDPAEHEEPHDNPALIWEVTQLHPSGKVFKNKSIWAFNAGVSKCFSSVVRLNQKTNSTGDTKTFWPLYQFGLKNMLIIQCQSCVRRSHDPFSPIRSLPDNMLAYSLIRTSRYSSTYDTLTSYWE